MKLITKQTLEKLKNGKKVRLDIPVTDTVTAHLVLSPKGGEQVLIRGYLYNLNPRGRITSVKEKSKTSVSYDSLPYDVRDLKNALARSYEQLTKPAAKPRTIRPESFAAQVKAIPDIENPDNFTKYVPRGWGKDTSHAAVSYYARTFGAFYNEYGFDATEADFHTFLESEIKRIYGISYPCQDGSIVLQRRENIYNGIMTRWSKARVVQKYLLEHHPEIEWPSTLIPVEPKYKAISAEELKTISFKQYITVLTLLNRLCIAKVPYAYAALLEAVCGARIGESCAPLIKEFEVALDYARYYIDYQIDESGNRTRVLKNENAHRFIFFTSLMKEMLILRKSQLLNEGFSADEIGDLPFASSTDDPHKFLRKQKVSAFIKEILYLAGCDAEWIERESERLFVTARATGNEEDLDVTAHLLRRTITTFFANGGIPINTIDAILGHENQENQNIDYSSIDKAREICAMIDRAIYLGNLCQTSNPAYTPVKVSGDMSYTLHGNSAYTFVAEEDTYMTLNVNCLECGNTLSIKATNGNPQLELFPTTIVNKDDLLLHTAPVSLNRNSSRPILPALPSLEEVECWISKANQIDLTEIIQKWSK